MPVAWSSSSPNNCWHLIRPYFGGRWVGQAVTGFACQRSCFCIPRSSFCCSHLHWCTFARLTCKFLWRHVNRHLAPWSVLWLVWSLSLLTDRGLWLRIVWLQWQCHFALWQPCVWLCHAKRNCWTFFVILMAVLWLAHKRKAKMKEFTTTRQPFLL